MAAPGTDGAGFLGPEPGKPSQEAIEAQFAFQQPAQCWWCYWYVGGMECRAFGVKANIPDEIMSGGFDHRQPYPGDNGRRFVHRYNDPAPEDW